MSSFTVDLDKQEVIVTGTIGYDDVLARIKKTGKEASVFFFYIYLIVIMMFNLNAHIIFVLLGSIWVHCQLMELYYSLRVK